MIPSFCPTGSMRFARLTSGGSFFRSKDKGIGANGITISAVNDSSANTVTLKVVKGTTTESYTVAQTIGITTTPTDGTAPVSTSISGIPALRTKVNADSQLIRMPVRGTDFADTIALDGDYLADFIGRTIGGDGLPSNSAGVDTGPKVTMYHINYEESDSGVENTSNSIYIWNGLSRINGVWQKR